MTKRLELYKCDICGNLVEVVIEGQGELVCCNEPMKLLHAGSKDEAGKEKHIPVFKNTDNGSVKIYIGSEPHPMIKEHYIVFIEAILEDGNRITRQYLYPEEKAEMLTDECNTKITAREFCNIHGLWEAIND